MAQLGLGTAAGSSRCRAWASGNLGQMIGAAGSMDRAKGIGMGMAAAVAVAVEIILLRVKRWKTYVTKYNLDACLIIVGHRLDTDELYNICQPNMYIKHGL